MVTKKIRSEYMKKFKDPMWENYAKCYEDSLKYRLTRRLLEQTHKPWFWEGCESESDSSGRSTPQNKNKIMPLKPKEAHPTAEQEPLQQQEQVTRQKEPPEPKLVTSGKDDTQNLAVESEKSPPAGLQEGKVNKDTKVQGVEGEQNEKEGLCAAHPDVRPKGPVQIRRCRKSTRAKSQTRDATETDKENRHPFALYGSGEKQAETAAKRTHNVGPCASTNEIHESALRAKTRREVERQMKAQNRRRARSADMEKTQKTTLVPDYDPWMTEYMRCYSARSR